MGIECFTPGTYELILHFRCGEDGGGTYTANIDGEQTLGGEILPTPKDAGNWKTKRTALVGDCVLDQHTTKLTLSSITQLGATLLDLQLVELAPQGTWEELQTNPTDTAIATPGKRQFEKLEGARWIDKDTRKPGEIIIEHEGKEHTFRLYFIQLPPAEAPSRRFARDRLKRAVKQLSTTEEKLLRYGKKVDAKLRERTWSEDLTIYTMWESRGLIDCSYAYILLNNEPLSLSLITDGEARLGGSFATSAPFVSDEKRSAGKFRSRLKAAEKHARESRRGMWGL